LKSVDCFYSSGRRTTNGEIVYRGECKSCHKIRKKRNLTTEKIIRKRAYGLIERLSNTNNAKNKCYKNVNCKIGDNVQEVYDYLLRFKNDFKKLIKANKTPSVDRIDSNTAAPPNVMSFDGKEALVRVSLEEKRGDE